MCMYVAEYESQTINEEEERENKGKEKRTVVVRAIGGRLKDDDDEGKQECTGGKRANYVVLPSCLFHMGLETARLAAVNLALSILLFDGKRRHCCVR